MKILSVVGARPQFIKVKPLIDSCRRYGIKHTVVHTGQHYDYKMSRHIFRQLRIPKPDYNLNANKGSDVLQTSQMLSRLERVYLKEKPDIVLVYGDTRTTLAGSLAARKINLPVGHVEAGLRSFNKTMPEEINRLLTDQMSNFLFCPTRTAVANLKAERITKGIYLTGDVMFDIFEKQIKAVNSDILSKLKLCPQNYFLLTIHRQENTDNIWNLKAIFNALRHVKTKIIFPVHPRTKNALRRLKSDKLITDNIVRLAPVGYLDMLVLEKNALKILTDSGGVQKEAYFLNVPCVTLRKETEWPETLNGGWNQLTGTTQKKMLKALSKRKPKTQPKAVFGNGSAAEHVIKILKREL